MLNSTIRGAHHGRLNVAYSIPYTTYLKHHHGPMVG